MSEGLLVDLVWPNSTEKQYTLCNPDEFGVIQEYHLINPPDKVHVSFLKLRSEEP